MFGMLFVVINLTSLATSETRQAISVEIPVCVLSVAMGAIAMGAAQAGRIYKDLVQGSSTGGWSL